MNNKKDFLFKFLPKSIRDRLQLDDEALFSVTDQQTADKITNDLLKYVPCTSTITDGTACIGGNTFSLSRVYNNVNAVELDKKRFKYLKNNMALLGADNVYCYEGDIMDWISKLEQDMIFLDPPWGGPDYKTHDLVDLYLSNIPLYDICHKLKDHTKYIAIKTPTNFNIQHFLDKTNSYLEPVYRNLRLRKLHLYIFRIIV